MFALNLLVQIAGLIAALYIAFTRSLGRGVLLWAVVSGLHFLVSKLSSGLMLIHQKTLSKWELQQLAGFGVPELSVVPRVWRTIATACGMLYFCLAIAAIWLFLIS